MAGFWKQPACCGKPAASRGALGASPDEPVSDDRSHVNASVCILNKDVSKNVATLTFITDED